MNLSQEIITVLNYMCQKFGIAIDWTSENVVPYIEDLCGRYIEYEIYTSIAWCVIFAVIVIATGLAWGIAEVIVKHLCSVSCIPSIFKYVFFMSLIVCVLVCSTQAFDIIECYTIPEKTILEYLKFLMNTTTR